MTKLVVVGQFGKTYGIRGWLKVNSFTNPITNVLSFKSWIVGKEKIWYEVAHMESKVNHDSIIVKLPTVNNCELAKAYTNLEIAVEREEFPELKNGEHYWTDLEGMAVVNKSGVNLGKIHRLLATGANDVLVVKNARQKEILIPYLHHVVLSVDLAEGLIRVDWEADSSR